MRKHMFLVEWERKGRVVEPTVSSYAACDWPLPGDMNTIADAAALRAMTDDECITPEVKRFCSAWMPMNLRCRYGNEVRGPFMINDEHHVINTREELETFVKSLDDESLEAYRMNGRPRMQINGRR
jgi:hypothetical protein